MNVDEADARRIVLARAIETADALVGDAERDEFDVRAVEAARADGGAGARDVPAVLRHRARLLLDGVAQRHPALAALQHVPAWQRWVIAGLPLLALLLGIATDRIANPHRIDLLSLPLLAIVVWNLAVYLILIATAFRGHSGRTAGEGGLRFDSPRRLFAGLRQWQRQRGPHARTEAIARFFIDWHAVSARLADQRIRLVLHLSAAAWGAGIALSLFLRGLVVEYRAGWESTFLGAEQVQAILSVLFMPVVALFSLAPFTLPEIAAMRFDAGGGPPEGGRRWVYLYAGLLLLVVVVPRLLLAAAAAWRARTLSRSLTIDLDDPYFQQLIDRLTPAHVCLWIHAHRAEDRAAIARVLMREHGGGVGEPLVTTALGDALRIADAPDRPSVQAPEATLMRRWWSRYASRNAEGAPVRGADARDEGDVVLHVVGSATDIDAAGASLQQLGKPVVMLVNARDASTASDLLAACLLHKKHRDYIADVLLFDAFARAWVQEPVLLDAIGRCMARSKGQGFARLAAAWEARNMHRFERSMAVLASGLAHAAAQVEEVPNAGLSLKSLVSKAHREARDAATENATAAVVARLRQSDADTLRALLALNGVDDAAAAGSLDDGLEVKFAVRSTVDSSQAGMAGAASGAAMGLSIDAVTGGLTLGVAALLGALAGGSAAFVSAAWKNRALPSGAVSIQLGDEMLQAMVEAALLRYLAVIHAGRGSTSTDLRSITPAWNSEVVAAVEAQRSRLQPLWSAAREQRGGAEPAGRLADELGAIARKVLRSLYPDVRIPNG